MQRYCVKLLPAILLTVQACDWQPERLPDNVIQDFRENMPGMTEQCLQKIRYGGIEAMPSSTDKCFEMTPAQRWKGLWRREFENSRFCPSPATSCPSRTNGERIWFSGKDLKRSDYSEGVYQVEFIGRHTAKKGHYGHMGVFDHEILVDKIIAISPVSASSNSVH